ncbi:hypothetical protein VW29_13350 [Devosia limi DSM 17137]|uniref:Uncharacterized protein n=1 Tax=Devosia limi DSM 17137 TaxID=1121477 RepID=A0A0F5LNK3_9HYPH|nr:hypothetical protein VW29_13350 [Devosia limi DSM 17137]
MTERQRHPLRHAAKIAVWALGIPAVLSLLLYLVLLITPIRLPFGSEAAQAIVRSALPPTSKLELGQMALALESGVWPVIQFSPVVLTDTKTGARVQIDALELGFSPVRALIGQPGATVTIVGPHVQIVQDLFGPRVTTFEMLENSDGGAPTVRVMEGEDSYPSVDISSEGLNLRSVDTGGPQISLRSDNDWLIYNLEASEQGLADILEQVELGRFSRLIVRDGIVDMNDTVYGLFRRFEDINLDLAPSRDRTNTVGTFSATLGGRAMTGGVSRVVDEAGGIRLEADVTNIDFASFLPFIDDPESLVAVRGAGALSINVTFEPNTGKLLDGAFKVDMTGLDLRVKDDYFPIATSIMDIAWSPSEGKFTLADAALQVGQSTARVSGIFAMGLDELYGPTMGISIEASDVYLHPNDMQAPAEPFDEISFSGWSAPLYGALGIDRMRATKGAAIVESKGRVDMLRAGLGFDVSVAGKGVSADDLKRLWPYVMGGEARDWFVSNVSAGTVGNSTMHFVFPVGTVAIGEEDKPLPKNSMRIDMVGTGASFRPTEEMAPIAIDGDTRLQVRDSNVTISAGGGRVDTAKGPIEVSKPALIMDNSVPGRGVIEVSGDISGSIPALVALTEEQQPGLLANAELPVDIKALTGNVDLGLVSTITLGDEKVGRPLDVDYVINGNVTDFASSAPIQERRIDNGQLAFSASQDGYQVAGTAEIDGMPAELEIGGSPDTRPAFRLASTIDAKELAAMGFDASAFLTGKVRFVAQPMPDGSIQMAVDLKDAALTIKDIGVSKAGGVPGTMQATIRQSGDLIDLTDIKLGFGTVQMAGAIKYHAKDGLQSAEFSQFALSSGDNAQLALAPIEGGYKIQLRGGQLDLRPMLKRFFGLDEGSGGVQSSIQQTLALDVELDRALGFYATTAFNFDLDLLLRGSDIRRANVTAQFSEGNALSVTTNPTPDGRVTTVAFSDAGTILRLLGVYSQLAGGEGNLVLNTISSQKLDMGQLQMRNFAIVDEAKVAQVLGNHADSRAVIEAKNRLDFDSGVVNFIRRSDRVEVSDAMLTGDTVGGTMRGFIYTNQRQYDLTGTYVPLFGLNSVFQKIPLLGPLLGGRDGEGLVGVTFAVQGPLDKPEFKINPLSALVPGAFRELFEFRAKEQPRAAE